MPLFKLAKDCYITPPYCTVHTIAYIMEKTMVWFGKGLGGSPAVGQAGGQRKASWQFMANPELLAITFRIS